MDASVNLVKQITDKKCLLPFITIIISSRTKMMKDYVMPLNKSPEIATESPTTFGCNEMLLIIFQNLF